MRRSATGGHENTRRPCLRVMPLVAIVGIALAACGDDSPSALSKAEFVEQADAICAATNAEVEPIFEDFYSTAFAGMPEGPTTETENQTIMEGFDGVLDEVTPIFERQVEDLRALGAPEADGETIEALLADFESAMTEMNEVADAAVAGDEEAIHAMTAEDAQDPFSDVNARARDYGLTVCGSEEE